MASRSRNARLVPPPPLLMSCRTARVVGGISNHGHRLIVFGRAAHQRGAADVDLLNCFGQRDILAGDGRLEGIKIYHHQIDGNYPVLIRLLFMLLVASNIEQAAVNLRMQCLDASARESRANR